MQTQVIVPLIIASIAFYGGQGRVPEAIRIPALLAAAVLLPLVATSYWFWRLRVRHGARESRVDLLRTVGSE